MKFSPSNKTWVLFSTAIIIGIAFAAYFLVYVKGNEKDMVSNNFRVLEQIAININSLENSFLKNAESYSFNYSYDQSDDAEGKYYNRKIHVPRGIHYVEADSLYIIEQKKIFYGIHELFFRVEPFRDTANIIDAPNLSVELVVDSTIISNAPNLSFELFLDSTNISNDPKLRFKLYLDSTNRSNDPNYYYTSYEAIYDNELVKRTDVFDQIIISKLDVSDGKIKKRDLLFSNGMVGIMDSTYYQNTLQSAKAEITVNDKQYISFSQLINDSNLLINGLVLKSTFEKQKRSVSPHLIFALSVALVLTILSMPYLKLKIISMEERLHIKDVVLSVIFILIGSAIFIVFLNTIYIFLIVEKDHIKCELETLSKNIEDNFQDELGQITRQIDNLNNHFPELSTLSGLDSGKFKLDKESEKKLDALGAQQVNDSVQNKIIGNEIIDGYKVYYNIIRSTSFDFKHLKAAFWSDDKANLLVFLSAFNQPGYAHNLSHRKYITDINEHNPDFFIDDSAKIHAIAIESIKSVIDGSYEVGVGKATGGSILPVLAISAKMASTTETIMEEGYGFCILDKEGNTMFHSDVMKNMNENFISETQGVFMPSIVSHTSMLETVNYNGEDQSIYFRPLDCLSDHYIATFVIPEVHFGPVVLSMVSAFILFLLFLIFVLSISLILYFSNFKLTKLKQIIYVFNFIRPYETDAFYKKYKRFIVVSLVIILYLILSILFNGNHYDFIISELALVILVMLICYLYSFSTGLHEQYLIHSGIRKPSKNYYYHIALFIIFMCIGRRLLSVFSLEEPNIILKINSIIGLLFMLWIVAEVFYDKKFIKLNYLEKSAENPKQIQLAYVNFLMLLVIILSIIPIHLFMKIAIQHENEIFAKFRSLKVIENIREWEDNNRIEFVEMFDEPEQYNLFVASMKKDSINYALVETTFKNDSIISFAKKEIIVIRDSDTVVIKDPVIVVSKDSVKVMSKDTIKYAIENIIIKNDGAVEIGYNDSIYYFTKDEIRVIEDSITVVLKDSVLVVRKDSVLVVRKDSVMVVSKDSIKYAIENIIIKNDGAVEIGYNDSSNYGLRRAKFYFDLNKIQQSYKGIFDEHYKKIRTNFSSRSSTTKNFINNVSSDSLWFFNTSGSMNVFTYVPKYNLESPLTSIIIRKNDFFLEHSFFILLITAISIALFYNFLNFILIKIYGFNFKRLADKAKTINNQILSTYFLSDSYFSNNSSYNNIFIVGVNSAHTSFLKNHFNTSNTDNFLTLDFYDFRDKLQEDNRDSSNYKYDLKLNRFERDWEKIKKHLDGSNKEIYVLIEHFEYGYNDLKMNKMKLEILKYLVDCENFKVLVKSEINATKFLDFYSDSIKDLDQLLMKSNVGDRIKLLERMDYLKVDYKKWQHLLGSFVKYIIPMNTINKKAEPGNEKNLITRKWIETGKELEHGEFLHMLNNYLSESSILDVPDEDKILTIQQMSYPYYFSVWNSLSKDERYIVYDISNDRFVNTVNSNAILSLLKKGILVYDHSLRLMNESFAEFVLTKVNSDEALEMEMLSRKKGTWSTAFGVIVLLIISLVIFLSMGQQNFLNDINAFLTGIAALAGLLLRFSGFLSFGGNKGVSTQ